MVKGGNAIRGSSVPVAPFAKIVAARVLELGAVRTAQAAGVDDGTILNILHRKKEHIHFDVADKIVTRLIGPMGWYEDEELQKVYLDADLRSVDWADPPSDEVRNRITRISMRALSLAGTLDAAGELLKVSKSAVKKYIPNGTSFALRGFVYCAAPECDKYFNPNAGKGGKPKAYCSPKCRVRANNQKAAQARKKVAA